jgi:signal transduction histidine kinase
MDEKLYREKFLSSAVHELRSPLASIKAVTQILKRQAAEGNDKKLDGYLDRIEGKVDYLTEVIDDLTDLVNLKEGRTEYVNEMFDFDEFAREVANKLRRKYKTNKLSLTGLAQRTVIADKGKVARVWEILVRNAVKYSGEEKEIELKIVGGDSGIRVCVKDYGMGVSVEEKEHIFKLYYRSESEKVKNIKGLGVGLYIAAQIMNHYGGNIWLEESSDKGSTFCFSIPTNYQLEE